jgi:RNA polymerase sigma-70 factor (ECF subfamily)
MPRRGAGRPAGEELPAEVPGFSPSPLEEVIGKEALENYEAALDKLPEQQREAVLLRIELGFTHGEVAEALGAPTPNAARMLVARGLAKLAEVMHVPRTE